MIQQKTRIYRRFTVELDYPQKLNVLVEDAGVVRLTAPLGGPVVSGHGGHVYLHASDFIRIAEMIKEAEVR
jgi:hypothetical protein